MKVWLHAYKTEWHWRKFKIQTVLLQIIHSTRPMNDYWHSCFILFLLLINFLINFLQVQRWSWVTINTLSLSKLVSSGCTPFLFHGSFYIIQWWRPWSHLIAIRFIYRTSPLKYPVLDVNSSSSLKLHSTVQQVFTWWKNW